VTIIFIYVRIHNLRIGKISTPKESDKKERKAYTKAVETKDKTAWYGKNIFKLSILLFLKFFVFIGFVFKQILNEISDYLKDKMKPKKQISGAKPSAFIGTMREYKNELSKFQKGLDNKK
ncbi:MAG: quinol-cytochrome oxidoreductase complex cytochrome b subunit, partial [Candidatus Paceibacteria bacterium]